MSRRSKFRRTRPAADIAAVLIVRDEARCLERCLASVAPFVDRIVVVDTGSTDDTVAIATRLGAEVHRMVWPDDFSKARNHALDLADADWNLVLDADEAIVAGGQLIRDWCAGPRRLGRVCIHSRYDAPDDATAAVVGDAANRSWITRLLPRGVRYERRVHEQPVSPLPRGRLALDIDHDGYLDAQLDRKRTRNQALLLRDLAADPDDPYTHYQLGKDAEMRADHAAASGYYAQAFAALPADANWAHSLTIRHLQSLRLTNRHADALALAERLMPTWIDSPDFFFELGSIALAHAIADPASALGHWLPLAESAWRRCLEIGERPELEGSAAGRGSDLAQHNLDVIRTQRALLATLPTAA